MNALRNMQQDFLGHMLGESQTNIIRQIVSNRQCSAEDRMGLYANAYVLRLKEALLSDYERLHAYLGDEQFENLMDLYIKHYPSHQTSLRYFGQHMVSLLEQHEPYSEYPELTEIALIEQVFANSFDAANAVPVTLEALHSLEPEAWAGLKFQFHNHVQLLTLRFNSFQIWRALAHEENPPDKIADASTWMIWRCNLVSRYRGLEQAETVALKKAMSGTTFGEICSTLLTYFDENETPMRAVAYLKIWIQEQLLKKLELHA